MEIVLDKLQIWMEVWALFIPLAGIFFADKKADMLPVKVYVVVALILNLWADISWQYQKAWNLQGFLTINTWVYSIHSVCRFGLLCWFFYYNNMPLAVLFKKIIPVLFLIFVVILFFTEGFIYHEYVRGQKSPQISYRLLSVEACVLLFYCLAFYFKQMQDDITQTKVNPAFWIVTGLCIFSVCSFPVYLFYPALLNEDSYFTRKIWLIQKLAFLVFCVFISVAFSIKTKSVDTVSISQ